MKKTEDAHMLRIRLFIALLTLLLSNTARSEGFFGLWDSPQGSGTYAFRPLDETNVGMVVAINGFQDIYVGSYSGANISVCTTDQEPFKACYSGTVNSETSLSLNLDSCENKSEDICSLISSVELNREIIYDIDGIFYVALTGEYFMLHDGGGFVTAHNMNVEDGVNNVFEGPRTGNTGSVVEPLDPNAPELDFEVQSADEIKITVTSCDDCSDEDAIGPDDVGLTFSITRVTN